MLQKKIDFVNFNATEATKIVNNNNNKELYRVFSIIITASENLLLTCIVQDNLRKLTLDELRKRGFRITKLKPKEPSYQIFWG